jgi:hypothetical protein
MSDRTWVYRQSTGELIYGGDIVAKGYSGFGQAKNDPAQQGVAGLGPIPQGVWTMGPLSQNEAHGPLAITLIPSATTNTFGRSGFLCHGDSLEHAGGASHGCIIMPRQIREEMIDSPDKQLLVVP